MPLVDTVGKDAPQTRKGSVSTLSRMTEAAYTEYNVNKSANVYFKSLSQNRHCSNMDTHAPPSRRRKRRLFGRTRVRSKKILNKILYKIFK